MSKVTFAVNDQEGEINRNVSFTLEEENVTAEKLLEMAKLIYYEIKGLESKRETKSPNHNAVT